MAATIRIVFTIARMLYVQFSRGSRQVVSDLQRVEACVLCADREVQGVYNHINPSFLRSLVRYTLGFFFDEITIIFDIFRVTGINYLHCQH